MPTFWILFFILTGLLAGALIGYLVSRRYQPSTRKVEEERPPKDEQLTRIMCIWRDRLNGQLVLEIGSRFLRSSTSLSAQDSTMVRDISRELVTWTGIDNLEPEVSEGGNRSSGQSLANPDQGAVSVTPEPSPSAQGSIVSQVDHILQEMLASSEFSGQRIYLTEDARHGVIVWVGPQKFEGVDNVEIAGVRTMIHNAVTEWERRQAKR